MDKQKDDYDGKFEAFWIGGPELNDPRKAKELVDRLRKSDPFYAWKIGKVKYEETWKR